MSTTMTNSHLNHHHHHHHHHYKSLKLLPIAALLIVTPLLSSSLRFKYLYFIVNILIIAVGAEAGLVSFFLRSGETKKPYFPPKENKYLFTDKESTTTDDDDDDDDDDDQMDNGARSVNKIIFEVNSVPQEAEKTSISSSSNPSIFFIGGGESENVNTTINQDDHLMEDDYDDEELFQKAEMFIGNFYKQLKMQREESRKRLAYQ